MSEKKSPGGESRESPEGSAEGPKESAEGPKEPNPTAPDPAGPAGKAEEPAVDEAEDVPADEAQLEEEIKKVRVEDVILQSTVSILNLAARRIAKDDERDLAQGKIGIDASKALLDYLPEDASDQVREAVSELQLLYAKRASETT